MVNLRHAFNGHTGPRNRDRGARKPLLPHHRPELPSALPAEHVTKIALKLKYLVEQTISCEMKESMVTKVHGPIITPKVLELARGAGGNSYKGCVVYGLLVCMRWFKRQAILEMYDADLNMLRATACQVIAKRLIELEQDEDQDYLFNEVLLKRYSILRNGEETPPMSAVERAIDLHATIVIGASGYQKCIQYLWKGWITQDPDDATRFCFYKNLDNTRFWAHFDPDRLKAPVYQNWFQIAVSFIYLLLYTLAINSINPGGEIDAVEVILYIFTASFVFDELSKLYKVGRYYISFWNIFNVALYTLLTVSLIFRFIALGNESGQPTRKHYNAMSYNFLAFTAPMFWIRILLYLDSNRFFGAMLVILKTMMKESFIFFALLVVIVIGFLQGFLGMDIAQDSARNDTGFILKSMANALMQSPDFDGWDDFSHPFGLILYYIFAFLVMVILLNILIALFNQAYTDITDNAIDEYLGLFSHKTMQFVRAPDENVFMPPFNLIEIFCLILPLEWWMRREIYAKLNDAVMATVYSPVLVLIAFLETREARKVLRNRARDMPDDDRTEEWEELGTAFLDEDDWGQKVATTIPNVTQETAVLEILKMKDELEQLIRALKDSETIDPNSSIPHRGEASEASKKDKGPGGDAAEEFVQASGS